MRFGSFERRVRRKAGHVLAMACVLWIAGSAQATPVGGELWWGLNGLNPGNLCQTVGGTDACGVGFDTPIRAALDRLPGGYEAVRGNSLFFDGEGPDLLAAAFSTTGAGNTFETAFLGNYAGGLGVLNEDPQDAHTVSNAQATDLVVFSFPGDDFLPTGVDLRNFGDSDVTILVGGTAAQFASGGDPFAGFAGLTFADLVALGFNRLDDLDDDSGNDRVVPVDLGRGRYIVVAALEGDRDEAFKIRALHGSAVVAEPGTTALLGAGLLGLALFGRRRLG